MQGTDDGSLGIHFQSMKTAYGSLPLGFTREAHGPRAGRWHVTELLRGGEDGAINKLKMLYKWVCFDLKAHFKSKALH